MTPPRTLEEIAEALRLKFSPRLSHAFANEDRDDILTALREAAEAARQEEREIRHEGERQMECLLNTLGASQHFWIKKVYKNAKAAWDNREQIARSNKEK